MLDTLIHQLGHEFSMEDQITLTEEHHFILSLDNNIEIEAIEGDGNHLFKGIIGNCPEQNLEAFLRKTMEANLFGMGTRGGIIGLNEDGKLLTLSMELDYNSSFKDFKEKLEDFVSVLDFWRNEAAKHE